MEKLLTTLCLEAFFRLVPKDNRFLPFRQIPEIEGKIEKLLKGMTLEEKIGQMCELTIGVVTDKTIIN